MKRSNWVRGSRELRCLSSANIEKVSEGYIKEGEADADPEQNPAIKFMSFLEKDLSCAAGDVGEVALEIDNALKRSASSGEGKGQIESGLMAKMVKAGLQKWR